MLDGGIKLYYDNVLAEIAHPPVRSSEEAVEMFRSIFTRTKEHLGSRYSLHAQAAHEYDSEQLGPRSEENPAWAIGCNPNLDAYLERENPKVEFSDGLRTGSFHIHLGHDSIPTMDDKANASKLLDIFVGAASVLFDKDPTAGSRRKYWR